MALAFSAFLLAALPGAHGALAQTFDMGAPASSREASKEDTGRRGRLAIDYGRKIDFLARGKKFLASGDTGEAMYNANYAIEYGSDTYESYLLLADIYRFMKQDADEAKTLEFVERFAPNERLRGEARARLDAVRKKIRDMRIRAAAGRVAENPENPGRVIRLGQVFSGFDDDESAMEQYRYVEAAGGGKFKSSVYAQIRLLLRRGKVGQAKPAVKKYFALEPEDTQMVYLLASHGLNLNESKELGYNGGGKLDMRKFNRTYADYYFRNGYNQYLKENYESARHSFEYALEYFMTIPRAHKLLGEIYYRRGMFREAVGHLKISYEFLNTDYEVGVLLSRAYLQLFRMKEARLVLADLLRFDNRGNRNYYDLLAKTGLRKHEIEKLGYVDPDAPPKRARKPSAQPGVPGGPDLFGSPPPGGYSPSTSPLLYDPNVQPASQQTPYTISPTGGTSYPPPPQLAPAPAKRER